MIIIIVLLVFLTSSLYVANLSSSINSTNSYIQQTYRKIQSFHIFNSALPIIIEKLREDDNSRDTLKDNWAYPLSFKNELGDIRVTIYDEDRFMNLKNIADPRWEKVFDRFFRILYIDKKYINNLQVWIGKKDGEITTKYPIKRAMLHSKEELIYIGFRNEDLLGKVIGNEFYPGLMSLTTVYSSGKININTAPLHVLMALDERIDLNIANRIIERRNRDSFRHINELVIVDGINFDVLYSISNFIDVKSRYFHIIVETNFSDTMTTFEAIYDRVEDKVVWKKII